jgi:hypothetical protein
LVLRDAVETAGVRHDWHYRRPGSHRGTEGWQVSRPTAVEEYADAEFSIVVTAEREGAQDTSRTHLSRGGYAWRAFILPVLSLLVAYIVAFAFLGLVQGNRAAQGVAAIVSVGASILAYATRLTSSQ